MFYGEPEGTGFEVLDPRFDRCLTGHGRVERLWTGARWAEGPAWFAAGRYLVFSDIPNNRMMRYDETDGSMSVFRQPSNNSNGNTADPQGRLVTCEHLARRVTRTEARRLDHGDRRQLQGQAAQLAERSRGEIRRLDLVHRSLLRHPLRLRGRQGRTAKSAPAMSTGSIRRAAPSAIVADDFVKPNGLAFSPDEKYLYIADTGVSHDPRGRNTSAGSTSARTARRSANRKSSPIARRASSTASAATATAAYGPAPETACIATIRTER